MPVLSNGAPVLTDVVSTTDHTATPKAIVGTGSMTTKLSVDTSIVTQSFVSGYIGRGTLTNQPLEFTLPTAPTNTHFEFGFNLPAGSSLARFNGLVFTEADMKSILTGVKPTSTALASITPAELDTFVSMFGDMAIGQILVSLVPDDGFTIESTQTSGFTHDSVKGDIQTFNFGAQTGHEVYFE